jgi:hypothetical protein
MEPDFFIQSIHALLEANVTVPRQYIAEYKSCTGKTLSFTGYLTYCLSLTVDEV